MYVNSGILLQPLFFIKKEIFLIQNKYFLILKIRKFYTYYYVLALRIIFGKLTKVLINNIINSTSEKREPISGKANVSKNKYI